MTIRKAMKKDSKQAAVLMYDAIHDIADALTGETDRTKVLTQLENYFCEEVNRLSYHNCLVKTEGDEAIGIIIAYHGKDADKLDAPILSFLAEKNPEKEIVLDKEADEQDYYLDTVSVNPSFAGKGIGTDLLQAAIEAGKALGHSRVSLNVEENNQAARRLYERLGFEYEKTITINGHAYFYLVKHV